jgi:hypothetical protein
VTQHWYQTGDWLVVTRSYPNDPPVGSAHRVNFPGNNPGIQHPPGDQWMMLHSQVRPATPEEAATGQMVGHVHL